MPATAPNRRSAAKLYYLASGPVPSTAANSVHAVNMCAALAEHGFEVVLASPRGGRPGRPPGGAAVERCYGTGGGIGLASVWSPGSRGGMWLYRNHLRLKLALSRPDYVYGRHLSGCTAACGLGMPTVFEAHMPVWRHNRRNRTLFESLVAGRSFRAVVVISEALSRALLDAYPRLAGKVIIAPDAAAYCERPAPAPGGRQRVEVLYAGSLYPGKGMELVTALAPRCPWAAFRVVGGSPEEIRDWQQAEPEAAGRIDFVGHRPHSRVRDYMVGADILIAPYQAKVSVHGERRDVGTWMSPLKIFEYMAANRPIVASDLPVIREILSHRDNALLADPGDVEAWVAALRELRDDRGLSQNIAANARKAFEDKHTWGVRARRVMDELGWRPGSGGA